MASRGRRFAVVLATLMTVFATVGCRRARNRPRRGPGGPAAAGRATPVPAGGPCCPGRGSLRGDRDNHGELKGWQTGDFDGREVAVPNAANGRLSTGQKGLTKFRGTVAWYRTTVHGPRRRRSTSCASSPSTTRRRSGSTARRVARHTGVYLPFEVRTGLRAGRAAHDRRARRLPRADGAEALGLASHLVQLRRDQPRDHDPPRDGERDLGARRSTPRAHGRRPPPSTSRVHVRNRQRRGARAAGHRRARARRASATSCKFPKLLVRPNHDRRRARARSGSATPRCGRPTRRTSTTSSSTSRASPPTGCAPACAS